MTPTLAFYLKLIAASVTGISAYLADALTDVQGWEQLSLKVILLAALVFVTRLLLQQQAEHKEEAKAREDKLLAHIEQSNDIQNQLLTATKEQTGYFQTVTRNIVNERLQERQDIKTIAEKVS